MFYREKYQQKHVQRKKSDVIYFNEYVMIINYTRYSNTFLWGKMKIVIVIMIIKLNKITKKKKRVVETDNVITSRR